MSAGELGEPRVITGFNQRLVCVLPVGFYFDDERWEKIRERFEYKGEALSMAELKALFPGEPMVQSPTGENGKLLDHRRISE